MITKNGMWRIAVCLLLGMALIPLTGCTGSDDSSIIRVCNVDNDAYRVELRRDSDDVLVDALSVDEWYYADSCDEFDDVPDGQYYVVIINKDSGEQDYSEAFYIENGEYEGFYIDSTGSLQRD